MRKIPNLLVIICLIMVALLGIRMPSVLGLEQTLQGIREALAGMPGTFIMTNPNAQFYLIAWPRGVNYGMTIFNTGGTPAQNVEMVGMGQRIGVLNFSQSVNHLQDIGWTFVHPNDVPNAIWMAIESPLPLFIQTVLYSTTLPLIVMPAHQVSPFPTGVSN